MKRKRLQLEKQTLRLLLNKELSLALGGTNTTDPGNGPSVNAEPCDTIMVCAISNPCGTGDTRGG